MLIAHKEAREWRRKGDEKVRKELSSKKTELHFKLVSITLVNKKNLTYS
jgi:hypothetical protein